MRVSPGPQVADQERRRGERACAPKRGKHILIQNKVIAFGIPASNLYLLGNRRSLWGQSVGEGGGCWKGRGGRAPRPGLQPTWLPASTALRPHPAATTRQRCLATTRRETSQLPHRPEPVAAFGPSAHDAGAADVTSSLASRPFAGSRDCADGRWPRPRARLQLANRRPLEAGGASSGPAPAPPPSINMAAPAPPAGAVTSVGER